MAGCDSGTVHANFNGAVWVSETPNLELAFFNATPVRRKPAAAMRRPAAALGPRLADEAEDAGEDETDEEES